MFRHATGKTLLRNKKKRRTSNVILEEVHALNEEEETLNEEEVEEILGDGEVLNMLAELLG